MHGKPHLKEYVVARLVTIAVAIFFLFSFFFFLFVEDISVVFLALFLMATAFGVFIYAIYRGADRMQGELGIINTYLSQLDKVDKIDHRAQFFTQEFEDINKNLIQILKASKEREDDKRRYNAKLKLKNRQRANMISAIAHEFRNPISSIMGYAQTLEEDKAIPEDLQERFLHKIYTNGFKLEALLGRLVLWNKFESGEATLYPTSFDIYALVQEVKKVLEEKYSDRKIVIRGESCSVIADRTLLEIVLENLIENALKYSEDEVLVLIEGSSVSVHDSGIGICASEIAKITKKFYRSNVHSWNNSMGLGLSIVKKILSLHHTKLDITSEKNKGSIFSFTL